MRETAQDAAKNQRKIRVSPQISLTLRTLPATVPVAQQVPVVPSTLAAQAAFVAPSALAAQVGLAFASALAAQAVPSVPFVPDVPFVLSSSQAYYTIPFEVSERYKSGRIIAVSSASSSFFQATTYLTLASCGAYPLLVNSDSF